MNLLKRIKNSLFKIGYKGTYNYICRDHKFEIGQTYELPYRPATCYCGFHYCKNPKDVLRYYPINPKFKLLEIKDIGKTSRESDKCATNKIKILREITDHSELEFLLKCKFKIEENYYCLWHEDGFDEYEWNEQDQIVYYNNQDNKWYKKTYDNKNRLIFMEYQNYIEEYKYENHIKYFRCVRGNKKISRDKLLRKISYKGWKLHESRWL